MTLLVWLSFALGLVIFLAVAVTSLWLVLRRPDSRPVPGRIRATSQAANSRAGHLSRSGSAAKHRRTARSQAETAKSPR